MTYKISQNIPSFNENLQIEDKGQLLIRESNNFSWFDRVVRERNGVAEFPGTRGGLDDRVRSMDRSAVSPAGNKIPGDRRSVVSGAVIAIKYGAYRVALSSDGLTRDSFRVSYPRSVIGIGRDIADVSSIA